MVCYPRALLSQANRYWLWQNCTSCVFLPLNMRDIYVPVFWFSLLKVVQQIARGSSSFEKLMFYSIQFHFVSAKMRTITFCWCARKVQIVKVICRVLLQWPCTVTAVRSALTLRAQRVKSQPSSSKELNPDVAPSANGQSGLFFLSLSLLFQ